MGSIIEESQKSRRGIKLKFNKKSIIILVLILLFAGGAYYYFSRNNKEELVREQKAWTVKQEDITISIESDGKVVAEDGVELSFSVSGDNLEIEEVFVKEGDAISKGDKIATVKTETLELNVRTAYASYLSALADYNETVDGATDKEKSDAQDKITSAEIAVEQSKISLANIEQAAEESIKNAKDRLDDNQDELTSEDVKDAYEALVDTIKSINISLDSILKDSDEILGVDDKSINDAYEDYIGATNSNYLNKAKGYYIASRDRLEDLDSLVLSLNIYSNYTDIDTAASQTEEALESFEDHLYYLNLTLEESITGTGLTQTQLNSFINSIINNRTSVNTKITGLNTKKQAVEDAKDNLEDYIVDYDNAVADAARSIDNAEASLRSKELSLEQAERDYQDLTSPLTNAEKNSANSRLTSASVSLEKAQLDLEQATITSPIDGEIAALNYKTGDIIVDNSNSDPVAVILNSDTLFIEVNIEEADINKIQVGQTAYATFDSLDELELLGEVSFISLTADTNNSGVVTYLVRIVITDKQGAQIREGMTAFVDFVTVGVEDVLIAPVDAVTNVNDSPSVLSQSGEWLPVVTGFTDGDYVEIIDGLQAGDKILY